MKFNLIINPSHQWQQSTSHALELIRTMLNQGHQINSVFFFGDAVQIAQRKDLQQAWSNLNCTTDFLLCRTMIEEYDIKPVLNNEFTIVGMGQLAINMELADRTVELN